MCAESAGAGKNMELKQCQKSSKCGKDRLQLQVPHSQAKADQRRYSLMESYFGQLISSLI